MHAECRDPIYYARLRPSQKAAPHPPGLDAQPQVEARRLDLIFMDFSKGPDFPSTDESANFLRRQ
jgi:hypothetical protein